jgi:hypothetical protein
MFPSLPVRCRYVFGLRKEGANNAFQDTNFSPHFQNSRIPGGVG